MYKLYYKKGSCSLAIHALLNELRQEVELINFHDVADYKQEINPMGSVPVLDDNGLLIREGAAIAIYLLEKHKSDMLPTEGEPRVNALQWLMFANATGHPSYSKLFFANSVISDEKAKAEALKTAAAGVSRMWAVVDSQLAKTQYVCGEKPSAADFLLTIYANWGAILFADLDIILGENVKRMLKDISSRDSYQKALQTENVPYKAAA